MKNLLNILLIIIFLFSCQTKQQKTGEVVSTNVSEIPDNSISDLDQDVIKLPEIARETLIMEKLSLNINFETNKYYSDTINIDTYKFIVFGGFYNIDLDNYYQYTYIDSIRVIQPFQSILSSDGIGGYLYKDKNYSFESIIRLRDINNDGQMDIEVYNDFASGKGSNSIYSVFLNNGVKFEFSSVFSIPNLFFDQKTNTYTSSRNGGHAGMIYGITTYKLQGDSLKPISYEYQDYQNEKRNYIKKFENLITGETKSEELNYD